MFAVFDTSDIHFYVSSTQEIRMRIRIVKQFTSLSIENEAFQEEQQKKYDSLFSATVRCFFVGASNCGTTNIMLNLIVHESGLKFEKVCINENHYINQNMFI